MNVTAILLSAGVMVVLGVLFGVILTIADKKFKVEVDPRVEAVRACLGGANCGACGYAGCDAFADAVVAGKAPVNGCSPSGAKGAEAIAAIMGVSAEAEERKVARVICQGDCGVAKERYNYDGYTSCATAAGLAGGPKMCRFACIGLGDCAQACAFGAIKIADGLAHMRTVCKYLSPGRNSSQAGERDRDRLLPQYRQRARSQGSLHEGLYRLRPLYQRMPQRRHTRGGRRSQDRRGKVHPLRRLRKGMPL